MSDFENDDKLESFLKTNQTLPPAASKEELKVLLARLDLDDQEDSHPFFKPSSWVGGLSALAAGIAAFVLVTQSPVMPKQGPNEEIIQTAFEDFSSDLSELGGDYGSSSSDSTTDIGEEYLAFVND